MNRVLFGLFALAACLQGGLAAKIETDQDVLVLTEANFDDAIKVRALPCAGVCWRVPGGGVGWGLAGARDPGLGAAHHLNRPVERLPQWVACGRPRAPGRPAPLPPNAQAPAFMPPCGMPRVP